MAEAGRPGAITIATNMAGRGTDIVLGGNPQAQIEASGSADEAAGKGDSRGLTEHHEQVLAAGGLHIIGTEHHDQGTSTTVAWPLRPPGRPGIDRFYCPSRTT